MHYDLINSGYGGGTGRLNDFYSYSFTTNTWEEVQVLSSIKPGKNNLKTRQNFDRAYTVHYLSSFLYF